MGVAGVMEAIFAINVVFHCFRLVHNSIQACMTLKRRRQQLITKWLGPPTVNDPNFSNDSSSEDDVMEKMAPLVNPDETPDIGRLQPVADIVVPEGLPKPDGMKVEDWISIKDKIQPDLIKLKSELWFELPPGGID